MDIDEDSSLRLAVVIGSVREGRPGPRVARWFAERARLRPEIDVDMIDLADQDVGLGARVAAADAVVVVTPEYDHSFPSGPNAAASVLLDELGWWARTLRVARADRTANAVTASA